MTSLKNPIIAFLPELPSHQDCQWPDGFNRHALSLSDRSPPNAHRFKGSPAWRVRELSLDPSPYCRPNSLAVLTMCKQVYHWFICAMTKWTTTLVWPVSMQQSRRLTVRPQSSPARHGSSQRSKRSHKVSGSMESRYGVVVRGMILARDFYTSGRKINPWTRVGVDEPGSRVEGGDPVLF